MSTPAIPAIESIGITPSFQLSTTTDPQVSFASMLVQGLERVNQTQNIADATLQAVASGAPIPPHQAILAMEDARMNLQLALQIRNKAIEGFQELMRIQL